MSNLIYYVQLHCLDGQGNTHTLYAFNKDDTVLIDSNNPSLPSGTSVLSDIIDNLGTLAFQSSINLPIASTSQTGVVRLNNSVNDTGTGSDTTAATTLAVGTLNNSVVHNTTNETVGGVKSFTDGVDVGFATMRSNTVDGDKIVTFSIPA